jgi:hypothetical protein
MNDQQLITLGQIFLKFLQDEEVFVWVDRRRLVVDGNIWNISSEEIELVKKIREPFE